MTGILDQRKVHKEQLNKYHMNGMLQNQINNKNNSRNASIETLGWGGKKLGWYVNREGIKVIYHVL